MKIGLTGGIACGKNFVAGLLAERGCYTIDADEVTRVLMRQDGAVYPAVVEMFGEKILLDNGDINRDALRRIITTDVDQKKLLEGIIHPAVTRYVDKWYGAIKGKNDKAIAVYHAPLLLESGGSDRYDAVVLVWCGLDTQLERLRARGFPPYEEAMVLMKSQMSHEERLKYAHYVINNDGTPEETIADVERVLEILRQLAYGC